MISKLDDDEDDDDADLHGSIIRYTRSSAMSIVSSLCPVNET